MNLAILGAGSFGTVLASIAAANGHSVALWARTPEKAAAINECGRNLDYHPDLVLGAGILATGDLRQAVGDADLVVLSVPSYAMREVCEAVRDLLPQGVGLVSTTKGVEAEGFLLMSQVIAKACPGHPVGVLSGPNLAKEIAARHLTASVIASQDSGLRDLTREALSCKYLRLYSATDLVGVELGGALKNIYAIACGLAAALDVGANTQAALMTRALAEMSRFAACLGGNPMTFLGLAGVGDLIVTCSSPLSRNYRLGHLLGQGKRLDEAAEAIGQVTEGLNTLKLVHAKAAQAGVVMPIVSGLYDVIFGQKPARQVAVKLMQAAHTSDVEFVLPRKPSL